MADGRTYPTPYHEVNSVLQLLLLRIQKVLDDDFVGMYVHGSLASGDFEPERSDVDFLVVTRTELSRSRMDELKAMHAAITASGLKWADKLEGSYIPLCAIRRYDPSNSRHPALSVNGSFDVDGHGSDWVIQRYLIREYGIVLAGPSPRDLIDPVSTNDLRRAVLGILRAWWSEPFPAPARFESDEYCAYAVLTMCRALHTLTNGTVVSKPVAAIWAKDLLSASWHKLIGQALAWRQGMHSVSKEETLDFLRFAVEQSRQFDLQEGLFYADKHANRND